MAEIRLNKVLKELNVTIDIVSDFLKQKGLDSDLSPNSKISNTEYNLLLDEFAKDKRDKEKSEAVSKQVKEEIKKNLAHSEKKEEKKIPTEKIIIEGPKTTQEKIDLSIFEKKRPANNDITENNQKEENTNNPIHIKIIDKVTTEKIIIEGPKATKEKIDLSIFEKKTKKPADLENSKEPITKVKEDVLIPSKEKEIKITLEPEKIETKFETISGPKILSQDKIDLSVFEKKPKVKEETKDNSTQKTNEQKHSNNNKPKRKRIDSPQKISFNINIPQNKSGSGYNRNNTQKPSFIKRELTEEEISKQVKETLEKLTKSSTNKLSAKYRKNKRDEHRERILKDKEDIETEKKTIKITEFITVNDLAIMMDVQPTEIISSCMMLGIMTTLNQRLDAETISIIVDEFGYKADFSEEDVKENIEIEDEDNLVPRPPIVVIMGHVDHGKTSLLDHIRSTNVIAGESGGITQHIGAYSVELKNKQKITFLDTPGHEAFTAMRARGAKITDVAVIVIAADDDIKPQTKEAISHVQAANVPFIIAINKVDKPDAKPDKIRESLSAMNILVEEWGGKIQCQEISAKKGTGVRDLLDKILLEAELLGLKANPNKIASGTVIEAELDKGRGYISTMLIENGTLKIGDFMLAGTCFGKVKAMFDERGNTVKIAPPSTPVSVLGLNGAPKSGDNFRIYENEKEAKDIANKKEQLKREQSIRVKKHITLDEIGRRIAIGDFKELNVIIKGDVDGSIEAISDSLQKLSTPEIQINVILKGVGQISESDVLLAATSDAIIIGFQVRPSSSARKIAETEQVDIKFYSIIYDIIEDIKSAMEGMLSPEFKEEVTCNVEIREIFKISKIGTIAGCMVLDGKITKNTKIRILRNGIVIHTGQLGSLKRFKDDVKEVSKNYECGLNIDGFNDIEVNDIIEGYEMVPIKKKL